MNKESKLSAFTIVELLIVVVVIAILAAVTIVSYNGISSKAKASAAQSLLSQTVSKVKLYAVDHSDTYPTSLSDVGITNTSLQYTGSSSSYCITATSQSVSYYQSNTVTTPQAGACPGHGVNGGGTITNLALNPSSEETALAKNNAANDATVSRVTDTYYTGTASTLLLKSSAYAFVNSKSGVSADEGEVYTASAWVKSSSSPVLMIQRGTANVPYSSVSKTVTVNQWTRISQSYTIPVGSSGFFVDYGWESTTASSGSTLYVDGIMLTKGSTLYTYADPTVNSSWVWSGTSNNSISVGPEL